MKKIYLIDDNSKNQRELYGASFVDDDKYKDLLCHIEKINAQTDLSFIDNAVCVMMHESLEDFIDGEFRKDSHKAEECLEKIIQDSNIPYVLFSDGHAMTAEWREETPYIVYSLKKSEFYRHLEDFIINYIASGNIDMKIIAYGRDITKHLISKWYQSIIVSIAKKGDHDILEIGMFNNKDLRMIIENSLPEIGISFNDLMCKIEDGDVTIGQFRYNLNNVISNFKKYGKNISSWK